MNHDERQCEHFEPLVSAMLDGELSGSEQTELEMHLQHCSACESLLADFRKVNVSVEALGLGNENAGEVTETFVITRKKSTAKDWLSVWRLAPLAAVAALVVGMFIVVSQPAPHANAEQLTPEQFVKPLADLNRINLQQQRDQELMLRTLGMDLRALKLELKQLENTGPEDRERLEKQIEMMLERVNAFERTE